MAAASDWKSFWDSDHSIYVNALHKDVHYRTVAEQVATYVPGPQARVMDYGCGEALHAEIIAAKAAELALSDSADNVRAAMARRFADNPRIRVLSPAEVERLPDGSFDLIVSNSMVQYLSVPELERVLALWRRLLAPGGSVIVGDVIPPDVGAVSDVVALLRFAHEHGFLLAALGGLARTAVSPYRKLRNTLGIAQYSESDFMQRLKSARYSAERLPRNLEHNPARMTFRARPV
jgi:SAM-dependent methyltransferase